MKILYVYMGCDFDITNVTKNSSFDWKIAKQKFGDTYCFYYRNINRGTTSHLYNIVLSVINIMNWSLDDELIIKGCCDRYSYINRELKHYYTENWKVQNDGCYINNCPVCDMDGIVQES